MEIEKRVATICEAISERQIIEFNYQWRSRVVEPYLVGVHEDEEELMLRAVQVAGESKSGGLPDWRLFRLNEMKKLKVTDRRFEPRLEEYEPKDPELVDRECWVGSKY